MAACVVGTSLALGAATSAAAPGDWAARSGRRTVPSADERGPHGGLKVAGKKGALELLTEDRGLRVYALLEDKTVGVMRATGNAVLTVNGGAEKTYPLIPVGEFLLAKIPVRARSTLEGEIAVDVLGVQIEVSFSTDERALRKKAAATPEPTMPANPAGGLQQP